MNQEIIDDLVSTETKLDSLEESKKELNAQMKNLKHRRKQLIKSLDGIKTD